RDLALERLEEIAVDVQRQAANCVVARHEREPSPNPRTGSGLPSRQVPSQGVQAVVPVRARLRQPVPRLAAATLRLDEPGVGERREVLRHRLARHRQLAGELGRGRRPALRQVADHLPPRRVGERAEDEVQRVGHSAEARSSSAVLHAGEDSRTTSLVPSSSSASVNSTSPSSSHSNASRSSCSTSVTTARRSSPLPQRKLAPPPGRRSRSTSFANHSSSRSGSVSASHTSSRGAGRTISRLIICNLQVALYLQLPSCTLPGRSAVIVGSVVPMVVEQDGRWERSFDIYSRLLRERIVFLGQEVDDAVANLIAAQLLHLDAVEPGKDIHLYVNSPGGSAYAGMAIYDTMQYVKSDVSTVCLG